MPFRNPSAAIDTGLSFPGLVWQHNYSPRTFSAFVVGSAVFPMWYWYGRNIVLHEIVAATFCSTPLAWGCLLVGNPHPRGWYNVFSRQLIMYEAWARWGWWMILFYLIRASVLPSLGHSGPGETSHPMLLSSRAWSDSRVDILFCIKCLRCLSKFLLSTVA